MEKAPAMEVCLLEVNSFFFISNSGLLSVDSMVLVQIWCNTSMCILNIDPKLWPLFMFKGFLHFSIWHIESSGVCLKWRALVLWQSWALHHSMVSRIWCYKYNGFNIADVSETAQYPPSFLASSSLRGYWKYCWKIPKGPLT